MILEKVYTSLRFFDTEVLVLAVCNEGFLGYDPGEGLFKNTLCLLLKTITTKTKEKTTK
jgi:hypothetical protein